MVYPGIQLPAAVGDARNRIGWPSDFVLEPLCGVDGSSEVSPYSITTNLCVAVNSPETILQK
jgi:hypothetical protein